MQHIRFILGAPAPKAAAWRLLYLLDLKTVRRLRGNRRR